MEDTVTSADHLSSASSDQTVDYIGWERFLPNRSLRILLVEEDSSTRQVVCALLSKCGYEVTCACDCSTAWDSLEQSAHPFDLVMADAMMPVLSGTDLLAKIMTSKSHCDIPVIMMSAHDSLDMVFKCLMKGAKDFLVKPLRRNELRNLWQHVWRRNRMSADLMKQGVQAKERQRTPKLLDESDESLSLSNDTDQRISCKDGRDAQKSAPCCTKPECSQISTQSDEPFPPTEQPNKLRKVLGSTKASRGSAELDFFGTMKKQPEPGQVSIEGNSVTQTMTSRQISQVPEGCDLTLTRMNSTSGAENDPGSKQGVRQSHCSAFSKYISNSSLLPQPCIIRSFCLPSDDLQHGCCCTGNIGNVDDRPRRPMVENLDKLNVAIIVSGHGNSTTLHFPKATHLKHQAQAGGSPFSHMSSCCEDNSKQVQDSLSIFKSPSLNSSNANNFHRASEGSNTDGSDPLVRVDLHKDAHNGGSMWGSTGTGSDKEDFSSSNMKLDQLLRSENTDCMDRDDDKYSMLEESNKPIDIDGFTYLKTDAGLCELPTYIRGNGNISDGGSSMIEDQLTGRSIDCVAAQDWYHINGWKVNESGTMESDSGQRHGHEASTGPDQKPLDYAYRSSFREAAIHKFREKRKFRCFEKRVRYHSRKKLAEQRPRVKGQFVRRTTFEPQQN